MQVETVVPVLFTSPMDLSPRVESRITFLYNTVITADRSREPVL